MRWRGCVEVHGRSAVRPRAVENGARARLPASRQGLIALLNETYPGNEVEILDPEAFQADITVMEEEVKQAASAEA